MAALVPLTINDLCDDVFLFIARHLSPVHALCLCRTNRRVYELRFAMLCRTRPFSSVEAVFEALIDDCANGWRAVAGPWSLAPVLHLLSAPVAHELLWDLLATNRQVLLTIRSFILRALPEHAAPPGLRIPCANARFMNVLALQPNIAQVFAHYTPERWRTALPPLRASPHAALRFLADDITNVLRLHGPANIPLLAHLVQEERWRLADYVNTAYRLPGRDMELQTQLLALGDVLGGEGLAAVMAHDLIARMALHDMAERAASALLTITAIQFLPVLPERLPAAIAALRHAGLFCVSRQQRIDAARKMLQLIDESAAFNQLHILWHHESRAQARNGSRAQARNSRHHGWSRAQARNLTANNDVVAAKAVALFSVAMADGDISLRDICGSDDCNVRLGDLTMQGPSQLIAAQLLSRERHENNNAVRVTAWRKSGGRWRCPIYELRACDDRRLLMAIVRSRNAEALVAVARKVGPVKFAAAMLGKSCDSHGAVLAVRVLRAQREPLLRAMLEGGVTLTQVQALRRSCGAKAGRARLAQSTTPVGEGACYVKRASRRCRAAAPSA